MMNGIVELQTDLAAYRKLVRRTKSLAFVLVVSNVAGFLALFLARTS